MRPRQLLGDEEYEEEQVEEHEIQVVERLTPKRGLLRTSRPQRRHLTREQLPRLHPTIINRTSLVLLLLGALALLLALLPSSGLLVVRTVWGRFRGRGLSTTTSAIPPEDVEPIAPPTRQAEWGNDDTEVHVVGMVHRCLTAQPSALHPLHPLPLCPTDHGL